MGDFIKLMCLFLHEENGECLMCLLYATQTTLLEIKASFLAYQGHQMGIIVLPQRSSTVGTFATTNSEVRNNTYYARPGQLSLGKLLEPWQKNTCNRLSLVERYNLLVNEQNEEGRDASTTWIVHIRPLVFVKRFS